LARSPSDLEAAATSLRAAVADDPSYLPARVALARASTRLFAETAEQSWRDLAVAEIDAAINQQDASPEPYLVLAELHQAAGEGDLRIEALREAVQRSEYAGPHIALADAYAAAGETEEAERAYQRAINLRPDYYDAHAALGILYCSVDRYDAAANEFRQAVRAAPENPNGHNNLGAVSYFLGRREEAMQAFEAAIALEPNPGGYSNLGTLYFEEGRFGDAVEMFEAAIAAVGGDLPANEYGLVGALASAQHWGGNRDAEAATYRRAIDLAEAHTADEPNDIDALASLAGFYSMVGQTERGLEVLESAIQLRIQNHQQMAAIAESFEDLGDRERALEWLQKAIENDLDIEWVERRPSFNRLRNDPRYGELTNESSDRG
jgi:tetratricopeptide (TPR) repeat protein